MEKLNNNLEFQEMRDQLNVLKRKLENEQLLNEQLLRKTMNTNISSFRRERWTILLVLPTLALLYFVLKMSLAFVLVTAVFFLLSIILTHYDWRGLRKKDFMSGDLCETSRRLIRLHRNNQRWLFFSIPFLILWYIWWTIEMNSQGNSDFVSGAIVGGIVGGVFGSVCGVYYYRKKQRAIKETIQQIEDLTKE